jgi:hypothetical protein
MVRKRDLKAAVQAARAMGGSTGGCQFHGSSSSQRLAGQSADHEHGGGCVKECGGGLEGCLDVLGEPAISVDP